MPIIGRLDDQVDEVLIKPLSRRPETGDARAEPPPQIPTPDDSHEATPETAGERDRQELPVWLL